MNIFVYEFAFCMVGLVILEGVLTYIAGMFSPRQMIAGGHPQGLPWIMRFGASWGDFFIITPMTTIMLCGHGSQWHLGEHWLLITIVWVINVAMHKFWSASAFPDSLCWNGILSLAGWLHFVYTGIAFTVIVLFYFWTKNINPTLLIAASVAIVVHVAIGNHLLLSLYNLLAESAPVSWGLKTLSWWTANKFKDPTTIATIIGISALLYWRCRYILAH